MPVAQKQQGLNQNRAENFRPAARRTERGNGEDFCGLNHLRALEIAQHGQTQAMEGARFSLNPFFHELYLPLFPAGIDYIFKGPRRFHPFSYCLE
jgi:hypothetical protein